MRTTLAVLVLALVALSANAEVQEVQTEAWGRRRRRRRRRYINPFEVANKAAAESASKVESAGKAAAENTSKAAERTGKAAAEKAAKVESAGKAAAESTSKAAERTGKAVAEKAAKAAAEVTSKEKASKAAAERAGKAAAEKAAKAAAEVTSKEKASKAAAERAGKAAAENAAKVEKATKEAAEKLKENTAKAEVKAKAEFKAKAAAAEEKKAKAEKTAKVLKEKADKETASKEQAAKAAERSLKENTAKAVARAKEVADKAKAEMEAKAAELAKRRCGPGNFYVPPLSCKPCPKGHFTTTNGQTACQAWLAPCPAGEYVTAYPTPSSNRVCRPCPAGTFTDKPEQHKCAAWRKCLTTGTGADPKDYRGTASSDRVCSPCVLHRTFSEMHHYGGFVCKGLTPCDANEWEAVLPTTSTDRQCEDHSEACPAGQYTTDGPVAANHETREPGRDRRCKQITECLEGEYESTKPTQSSNRICKACPDGTFKAVPGNAACKKWRTCPAGSGLQQEGDAAQDRKCEVCEVGREYSDSNDGKPCKPVRSPCPAGEHITADATVSSDMTCAPCDSGTFTASEGRPSCRSWRRCYEGKGLKLEGTPTQDRKCTPCEVGKTYSDVKDGSACKAVRAPCPAGEHITADATASSDMTCASCDSGTFTATSGVRTCAPWRTCPIGEGLSREGTSNRNRECAACVTGVTFSTADDDQPCAAVRAPCPPGQHTETNASPSADLVCAPNPPGTFTPTAGLATAAVWRTCPAGSGMDAEGTASTDRTCEACRLGKSYSPVDSGERCRPVRAPCPPGQYMDKAETLSSDRTCAPCDAGFFKAGTGNEACVKWSTCPVGQGKTVEGTSTADRQCAPCATLADTHHPRAEGGSFSDIDSGDACEVVRTCDKDEYQTHAPTASSDRVCATHRASCPAGQWTSVGVTAHADRVCSIIRTCIPGKYQTAAPGASSNRECAECGTGTYQNEPNKLKCVACTAGKHRNAKVASSAEAVACSACAVGKFQNSDGQTSCKECAAGRVQPKPRQRQCAQCGTGKYQPEEGKVACKRCVVGKFRSSTPASSYEPEACVTCANRQYTVTYNAVQDDTCKIATCPSDMVLRSNKCVRDGGWTAWGTWGLCDHDGKSDALGSAKRTRTCTQPAPLNGGNACKGSSTDTRGCRNGGWTEWGTRRHRKGGCTKTCGGGKQWRFCQKPVPLHGKACEGPAEQTCNDFSCTPSVACKHMSCTHVSGMIQVNHHHKDHEAGHIHHHCMFDGSVSNCKCLCNKVHGVPHHLFASLRDDLRRVDNDPHNIYAARTSGLKQATPAPTPAQVYGAEELLAATPDRIDGGWADWSPWSKCRPDTEDVVRVRSCTNPWPEHGGKACDGANEETKPCEGTAKPELDI